MDSFWVRLWRRKVVQWGVGYAAAAVVMLEFFDVLGGTFGWSTAILRALTVLVASSFIGALVIAWYHGERGHQRVTRSEIVLLLLVLVAGTALAWRVGSAAAAEAAAAAQARANRFRNAGGGAAPGQLALADRSQLDPREAANAVAVLPFANYSGDPANDYFSDGMTEDIIAQVGKIEGLRVISRTTAMRYKATTKSMPEIAEELRVDVVLEGSVRLAVGRVHVTARLVHATTDEQIWSEDYDNELTDVFAIQGDIAKKIAAALEAELTDASAELLRSQPTTDVAAQQEFWRGREALARGDHDAAAEHFANAIGRDSAFAAAYAELALLELDVADASASIPLPPAPASPQGLIAPAPASGGAGGAAADTTREIRRAGSESQRGPRREPDSRRRFDPREAGAHLVQMRVAMDAANLDSVIAAARNAVAVNPNDSRFRNWYARALMAAGRETEALAELRTAEFNDPQSSHVKAQIGALLFAMDRPAEAVPVLRSAVALDSAVVEPRVTLGLALAAAGDVDAAVRELTTARAIEERRGSAEQQGRGRPAAGPVNHDAAAALGWVFAAAGRTREAREIASRLAAAASANRSDATRLGQLFGALGEVDRALYWLERGQPLRFVLLDPRASKLFEPLEADPRFTQLLNRPVRAARPDSSGRRGGRPPVD